MESPAAERLLGWSAAEALGQTLPALENAGEDGTGFLPLQRVLRGESLQGIEVRLPRKGGGSADVSASAAPLRGPAGEVLGATLVLEDISCRKQAEAEREQLIQGIVHDLRGPLASILMACGALLPEVGGGIVDAGSRELIQDIEHTVERLDDFVRDLLDLSRMEAGQMVLHPREQVSGPLLRDAIEIFRPLARAKSIRLDILVGESVRVEVDRTRALQVFSNLLSNAIRFTPEGGRIEVRSRILKRVVQFTVSDTGVGIPADELPHVFDRFWQADRVGRGTAGLGLAIARGIVDAHGGTIRAESTPGRGATFVFTLPRPRVAPSALAHEAAS